MSSISNGQISVGSGTINAATATVSGGSIVVTAGTIAPHGVTVTAGTINTGTITNTVRTQTRFPGTLITTGGTHTLVSGAGVCHLMTVMGGSAGTIALYDGTSGTTGVKFGDFDSTNLLATYGFNRDLTTGLTVIMGTSTKVYMSYGTS